MITRIKANLNIKWEMPAVYPERGAWRRMCHADGPETDVQMTLITSVPDICVHSAGFRQKAFQVKA